MLEEERRATGASPVFMALHRVPFFLEPQYIDQPDGWWETHTNRQVRKFGSLEAFEQVKKSHRLMPRAMAAGLDKEGWSNENLDSRRQSSTMRAHRLIRWLDETLGWERAEKAYAYLSRSHFVKQGLLNDMSVLKDAAASTGVDPATTEAFLRSDEGTTAILGIVGEVHNMGIHSIPTLFINGRQSMSGVRCPPLPTLALKLCRRASHRVRLGRHIVCSRALCTQAADVEMVLQELRQAADNPDGRRRFFMANGSKRR